QSFFRPLQLRQSLPILQPIMPVKLKLDFKLSVHAYGVKCRAVPFCQSREKVVIQQESKQMTVLSANISHDGNFVLGKPLQHSHNDAQNPIQLNHVLYEMPYI